MQSRKKEKATRGWTTRAETVDNDRGAEMEDTVWILQKHSIPLIRKEKVYRFMPSKET